MGLIPRAPRRLVQSMVVGAIQVAGQVTSGFGFGYKVRSLQSR